MLLETHRSDVCDAQTLMHYSRDMFGVVITLSEKKKFYAQLKQFREDNPHIYRTPKAVELDQIIRSGEARSLRDAADVFARRPWQILAKGVEWGKLNGKNMRSLCGIFSLTDFAYQAGYIPELSPKQLQQRSLDEAIVAALAVETDPEWRLLLSASTGETRTDALARWEATRAPLQGVN
jgi:hypothetical protein